MSALNPASAKVMPGSHWLRTTGLDDFYMEVVEDTEKAMPRIPGKNILGIDGTTDKTGRGVCNLTERNCGRMSYTTSTW